MAPASKTLQKRVREAQLLGVNYTLVVGAQEEADGTVTVRPRNDATEGQAAVDTDDQLQPVSGTLVVAQLVDELQQRVAAYK